MWEVDSLGRTCELDLVEGLHKIAGVIWSFYQIQWTCSDMQADLPQTCSWFYLMLPCNLWHTACENNIIKYRNEMWWSIHPPPHHWLGCLAWAVAYVRILMLHFLTLQGNSNTIISQTAFIPYRPLLNNLTLLYICKNNGNITPKIRKWHCLPLTGGVWLWPT